MLKEKAFADAESAYVLALQFADEPIERGRAHNGLATAILKDDGSGAHDPRVLENLKLSVDNYLEGYQGGEEYELRQLFRKLFAQADITGQLAETYVYGQSAAEIFAPPGNPKQSGGIFLYNVIHHAEAADDAQAAVAYIDQLLQDYPDFMLQNKLSGALPYLIVKREILLGSSWESPSKGHVEAVVQILEDSRFDTSLPRHNYAGQLATFYVSRGLYESAKSLRAMVIEDIEEVLVTLEDAPENNTLRKLLRRQQLVLMYQMASALYLYESDSVGAIELAQEVLNADSERYPNLTAFAQGLIDQISSD